MEYLLGLPFVYCNAYGISVGSAICTVMHMEYLLGLSYVYCHAYGISVGSIICVLSCIWDICWVSHVCTVMHMEYLLGLPYVYSHAYGITFGLPFVYCHAYALSAVLYDRMRSFGVITSKPIITGTDRSALRHFCSTQLGLPRTRCGKTKE